MSKVVFLKLIPQSLDVAADSSHLAAALHDNSTTREKSAIVIRRTADNLLNIQGHDPTPCRDKYQCWVLFKNVAKGLLGISEDAAISVRFADPPYVTVNDIATILTEPRHVVSLLVSPLGISGSDEQEVREAQGLLVDKRDPYCRYRERYHSRGTVRTKCNFAEMNKLHSQLSEVSLMLQRTQEECDEIARRCRRKNDAKNNAQVGAFEKHLVGSRNTGTDYTADTNVEKLLHIAESLTNHIIKTNLTVVQNSPGQDAPTSSVLPDCPTDVCVRPNFSGGLYVMWNPLSETDIQIHHKPLEERRRLTELKKYPPRRIFQVMANRPTQPLMRKLFARGASIDPHADAYFTITAPLPVSTLHPYLPCHGYPVREQLPIPLSHGHHPYQADAYTFLPTSNVPPIPSNATPSPKPKTVIELKRSMSNEEKDCLHKHVSKHAILKVHEHVKSWKRLAHDFGMNEIEISRIDSDHRLYGVGECSYQMLLHWVKTNDSEPTYEKLVNALESARENHALHFVLENLHDLANSS